MKLQALIFTAVTVTFLFLLAVSLLISALMAEGLFRVVVDDGMVYELEMWKYAKSVKVRSSSLEFD